MAVPGAGLASRRMDHSRGGLRLTVSFGFTDWLALVSCVSKTISSVRQNMSRKRDRAPAPLQVPNSIGKRPEL